MSAERTPQTDGTKAGDSWLSVPLMALTRCVLRAPRVVLALAAIVSLLAIALTVRDLKFHTSRLDLLNPDSDYNKLWLDYLDEFGEGDDTVVVVRGENPKAVVETLDALGERIQQDDRHFEMVLHRVNPAPIRAKGLHYLPIEEVAQLEHALDEIQPILDGEWSQIRLDVQLKAAAEAAATPASNAHPGVTDISATQRSTEHLARLGQSLSTSLASESKEYASPWSIAGVLADRGDSPLESFNQWDGRIIANDGTLGFILLRLIEDEQRALDPTGRAIQRLREAVSQIQPQHPDTTIGLTGLPIMEYDEMQASQSDMIQASIVSLFGVACLFMAGLGGVRHPLLTVATLLLAMAWSFGYVTLAIGHLNILSVAFGVILIGLGIDFGIHYIARYLHLRGEQRDSAESLVQTAGTIGPGVCVGGLTTAIAFFAAWFTQFTGVAELGVIAGGGILLCLVGTLVVLPTMIYLADYRSTAATPSRPLRMELAVAPLVRYPMVTLFVGVLITGIAVAGIGRLRYDHNLMNLQPEGLESVELERMLLTDSEHSVWYAISTAESAEELLARKQKFEKLPSVERTEEILSLLPSDAEQKTPIIARIHRRLSNLPETTEIIPMAYREDLQRGLAAAAVSLDGEDIQRRAVRQSLTESRDRLSRMSDQQAYKHISMLQQQMAEDLLQQLRALYAVSQPQPPEMNDLPPSLVSRFVGKNEQHLLRIYGQGDVWDMEDLGQFVKEVKTVDPQATGQPLQTFFASHQMQRSYINAALYALAAVLVVLMLDFRNPSLVLLALLPVGAGMLQMFGLMGLLGIPLNPANMIVLPLILGIGLDDGVHVVHDYRTRTGRYSVSPSTVAAVVVTSLTTMVGFGSLMLSSHLGLQSLGRVLAIGVTCCMVSSLVLLPALLRWMSDDEADEIASSAVPSVAALAAEPEDDPISAELDDNPIEPREPLEPRRSAA